MLGFAFSTLLSCLAFSFSTIDIRLSSHLSYSGTAIVLDDLRHLQHPRSKREIPLTSDYVTPWYSVMITVRSIGCFFVPPIYRGAVVIGRHTPLEGTPNTPFLIYGEYPQSHKRTKTHLFNCSALRTNDRNLKKKKTHFIVPLRSFPHTTS